MKIQLGYVAGPYALEDVTYCRTMTYTRYQSLGKEVADEALHAIIKSNLKALVEVIQYNVANGVHFYRLSHNIIPLATHPAVDLDYVSPYQAEWDLLKKVIKKSHIRLDTHPDQFCVLNSIRPEVIESSLDILKYNDTLFDCLQLKQGKMILHGGGAVGGKEEALKRFEDNFKLLPVSIQQRIILENDDRTFTIEDILGVCQRLNIPMVLDYHHYHCNKTSNNLQTLFPQILKTWEGTGLVPKIHFSSPRSAKEKRAHHDFADVNGFLRFLNDIKCWDADLDVMLECKAKEDALFRLVRQLKFYTQLHFLDSTSFLLDDSFTGKRSF